LAGAGLPARARRGPRALARPRPAVHDRALRADGRRRPAPGGDLGPAVHRRRRRGVSRTRRARRPGEDRGPGAGAAAAGCICGMGRVPPARPRPSARGRAVWMRSRGEVRTMKVYVSVDMEGVIGLTDPEEMHAGGSGYERGCELMTGDANAAVDGAYAAGAEAVVVNDAHGSTKNLRIDLLDPRATLIRGPGKPMRMAEGLTAGFRAACFVGYHARAGVQHGVLNHTWMGKEIQNVYLNGELCGETRLVAGFAGFLGVPVVLVTGDEAVCEEAREVLGDVETVAVKRGIDKFAAELLPPGVAQRRIREATVRA